MESKAFSAKLENLTIKGGNIDNFKSLETLVHDYGQLIANGDKISPDPGGVALMALEMIIEKANEGINWLRK